MPALRGFLDPAEPASAEDALQAVRWAPSAVTEIRAAGPEIEFVMDPVPLDRFIPAPDVRERFEVTVHAPAALVLETAANFDMQSPLLVKAIFRLRERLLGTRSPAPRRPQGILEETRRLGWGVLAEAPGRFVICGARCQPWQPDVRFTALAPAVFAAYGEPDQVKIAWTLEAHAVAPDVTRLVQETRAVATDEQSRRKFRRYWRWARFGIVAIRRLMLPAVRRAAERRWALVAPTQREA